MESIISDIKETVGEFKVNITRQMNDFFNSHKAVRDNIIEIKKVKSEIQQQKAEINNVIQGYKDFVSDENQEKNAKEELDGENITKKIDEIKKQYDPKIKSAEEEISKLRTELENMKKRYETPCYLPNRVYVTSSIRNVEYT